MNGVLATHNSTCHKQLRQLQEIHSKLSDPSGLAAGLEHARQPSQPHLHVSRVFLPENVGANLVM